MLILTVYKKILQDDAGITALCPGGVHIGNIRQGANRPNILLEMPEEGEEYSHSGPSGLLDAHLKVTCRGDTDKSAALLGDAVMTLLKTWKGTEYSHTVQLTEKFKAEYKYDDSAKVHHHISEYTSFYRRD